MKRRDFISSVSKLALVSAISPILGCEKKEPIITNSNTIKNVAVIGAGAAGLYATKLLKDKGIKVTTFEASKLIGGRIRSLEDWIEFPIELGAETIHGEQSIWGEIARSCGANFIDDSALEDYIIHPTTNQIISKKEANLLPEFQQIEKGINEYQDYSGNKDISFLEYAISQNITSDWQSIFSAYTANEYGTSLESLYLLSLISAEDGYKSFGKDVAVSNMSFSAILNKYFNNYLENIEFQTIIKTCDFTGDKIRLTDTKGKTTEFDRVVITIPLTQLKKKAIEFYPDLPESKISAIQKLGIGEGIKVIFQFDTQHWPNDMGSLIGGKLIPEYYTTGNGRGPNNYLTAFVMGKNAEILSRTGGNLVNEILKELISLNLVKESNLQSSKYQIWGSEPYIGGAYSFPGYDSVGAQYELFQPVLGKIYFAGEACHYKGHFGTVHGAMETAKWAIDKMFS